MRLRWRTIGLYSWFGIFHWIVLGARVLKSCWGLRFWDLLKRRGEVLLMMRKLIEQRYDYNQPGLRGMTEVSWFLGCLSKRLESYQDCVEEWELKYGMSFSSYASLFR